MTASKPLRAPQAQRPDRGPRRAAPRAWVRYCLLACGVLCAVLGGLRAYQHVAGRDFVAYDEESLHPRVLKVSKVRPLDFMVPPSMGLPAPSKEASHGDLELCSGRVDFALERYRQACDRSRHDAYATVLAACLHLENHEVDAARRLVQRVRVQLSSVRSVRLLEALVDECAQGGEGRPISEAWIAAVRRCIQDAAFLRLHPIDLLADEIDRRLYASAEATAPLADPELEACLALVRWPPDEGVARSVLESGRGTLPLQLLAIMTLQGSDRVEDRELACECIQLLAELEPDNAYYDHLLAAHHSPELFVPQRAAPRIPDAGGPDPASVEHWIQSLRKKRFDAHVLEIHALIARAGRGGVHPFAAAQAPMPARLAFAGQHRYLESLVVHSLRAASNRRVFEPMAAAAFRLLDRPSSLALDPFLYPGSELRLHSRRLSEAALRAEAEGELRLPLRDREPAMDVPASLRFLHRYLLRPPPVPRLVREFREDFAANPGRVVRRILDR